MTLLSNQNPTTSKLGKNWTKQNLQYELHQRNAINTSQQN
jgi:hypothetical protein